MLLRCLTLVAKENKPPFFYKGVEPFPYQTRFKALKGSVKGKAQRRQYLLAMDLGRYKWYQSQTLDDVSAFSLFPEGGRHEAVCQ